jgi:hypothetical protein
MLYGVIMSWEPFFLSKSRLYKDQMILQRNYDRQHHLLKDAKNKFYWDDQRYIDMERIRPMMPIRDEKMLITLCFMLCTAVGLAVLLLGSFHIYLTISAQTTIEFHHNFHQRKLARIQKKKWSNPYSLHNYRLNWEQVYGIGYGKNVLSIVLSLLPSSRERDYYPAPVPGNEIRATVLQRRMEKLQQQQPHQPPVIIPTNGGVVDSVPNNTRNIPTGTDDNLDRSMLNDKIKNNNENAVGMRSATMAEI